MGRIGFWGWTALASAAMGLVGGARRLEQTLGVWLELVALCDVLVTVLFAPVRTGIVSGSVARGTWWIFLRLAGTLRPAGSKGPLAVRPDRARVARRSMGTFAHDWGGDDPFIPSLEQACKPTSGPPRPASLPPCTRKYQHVPSSASEVAPKTAALRLVYLFNSLVGTSVLSLTLTYLMQVYSALLRRHALGMTLHLLSMETGDAAELIAAIARGGSFESSLSTLLDIGGQITQNYEARKLYPLLMFYRTQDDRYSVARISIVGIDAVLLLRSALSDQRYGWLKTSGEVEQMSRSSGLLMATLEDAFGTSPGSPTDDHEPMDTAVWHRRYFAALERLRRAGVETAADERRGAEVYSGLRARSTARLARLASAMGYRLDEVDPLPSVSP